MNILGNVSVIAENSGMEVIMINCLLAGVGGQGTVFASRLIAQAAMENGEMARTAETIGMAQRADAW